MHHTSSHHQLPPNPVIPYLESSAVSISEHDLPHELVPPHGSVSIQEDTASLEITGEPHGILLSAAPAGTRE
jgi:hypothetical protein